MQHLVWPQTKATNHHQRPLIDPPQATDHHTRPLIDPSDQSISGLGWSSMTFGWVDQWPGVVISGLRWVDQEHRVVISDLRWVDPWPWVVISGFGGSISCLGWSSLISGIRWVDQGPWWSSVILVGSVSGLDGDQ